MFDPAGNNRPGRRSTLVAQKLSGLHTGIAILNQVRFSEVGSQGNPKKHGNLHVSFWSGKPVTGTRLLGIRFEIRNRLAAKLEAQTTGHTDPIMP